MDSTRSSDPGRSGFTIRLNSRASTLESLRAIAQELSSKGYTTVIEEVKQTYRLPGQDVLSTSMAWRLTWFRRTTPGWEHCGALSMGTGAGLEIPFTLA